MSYAIVTGSNRGLGLALATRLARRGYRVLLTSRNELQGEQAVAAVRSAVPSAQVSARRLDLASRASIEAFAEACLSDGLPIDVLFNNAGRMTTDKTPRFNSAGVELLLAINALGPLLLTRRLLPLVERSSRPRIVNTGSRAHLRVKAGELSFDDIDSKQRFSPSRAYAKSKLALAWWSLAMARYLQPRTVTLNMACPGFVPATIVPATKGFMRLLMKTVLPLMPFAHTVDEGASELERVAVDAALEGVSGRFFGSGRELEASPEARDTAKQERFWAWACAHWALSAELPAPGS